MVSYLRILRTGRRQSLAIASMAFGALSLVGFSLMGLLSAPTPRESLFGNMLWPVSVGVVGFFLFTGFLLMAIRRFTTIDGLVRRVRTSEGSEIPFDQVRGLLAAVRKFAGERHEVWALALFTEEVSAELWEGLRQDRSALPLAAKVFRDLPPGVVLLTDGAPRGAVFRDGIDAAFCLDVPLLTVEGHGEVTERIPS